MAQSLWEEEDSGCGNGQGRDQGEKEQQDTEEVDDSFRPLLSHLRLEKLPELAISLKTALLGVDSSTGSPLTCTVNPQPLYWCLQHPISC